MIIDRECKNALSPSFDQRAAGGGSSNLRYCSVQINEPVRREELAGTESDPSGIRGRACYLVNRCPDANDCCGVTPYSVCR